MIEPVKGVRYNGAMVLLLLSLLQFVNPGFEFLLAPEVALEPTPATQGLSAVVGNPAGLWTPGTGILFSYHRYPLEGYRSLAALKTGPWGLGVDYVNFGALEYQDDTPNDQGGLSFTPFALRAQVGRALRLDPELQGGLALAYVYQRIYDREYRAVLVSGGLIYTPQRFPWVRLGLAFENLGTRVQVRPQEYLDPPLRVSASVDMERGVWSLSVLGRYTRGYEGGWSEGGGFLGWKVHPWVFLRVGYVYGNDLFPLRMDLKVHREHLALRLGWVPSGAGMGQMYRVALELTP